MPEISSSLRPIRRKNRKWPLDARIVGSVLWVLLLFFALEATGQTSGELKVEEPAQLGPEYERPLSAIHVETLGQLWNEAVRVQSVRVGDVPTGAVVRRALRELDRTGRFADLRARLISRPEGVTLLILVRPRRLVQQVRITGNVLDSADERRALSLMEGDPVTELTLDGSRRALTELYAQSGYPEARIEIRPEDVDDPRRTLLRVLVEPGEPQKITELVVRVHPSPHHPRLSRLLPRFSVKAGQRLNLEHIEQAKEDLTTQLVRDQFFEAKVAHRVLPGGVLELLVDSGPHFSLRIEGNDTFGSELLTDQLKLDEVAEVKPELLEETLRQFYVKQGYLDITAQVQLLGDEAGLRREIHVWIREGELFQITRRVYPCLRGSRGREDIDREVNGVLAEQFPGVVLVGPVHAGQVDSMTGSPSATPRPTPYRATPWSNYSEESHQAVMEHLSDLYRSEGYLQARIGPATVVRRRCAVNSPPGQCLFEGPPPMPEISCEHPPKSTRRIDQTCVPDPARGVRCEAKATLVLPIHAGRQAVLYDVALEGNEAFSEAELLELAALPLGKALRRNELEAGLRRIQEHYEEEAFAFAQVDSEIELSPDHTRARVLISITERHRVTVSRIDVRGALETSESLIRSRLALDAGDFYRRSKVRRSEERIEALGVFTSVTLTVQDPGVPAREKVVVVSVTERMPQYLDTKGGFASADGFRIAFEYGHRNLGGQAIRLTLRSQLALRPPFLIAEGDVREKYRELSDLQRLERRNTVTLGFPNIGLGPLFGLELELLDLLSNERDFSHTRDAAVLRLLFRPRRQYLFQVGGSIELNSADILGGQSLEDFCQNPENNCTNLRVPEGRSVAYTQNVNASWDRRDVPLAATRGTFIGGGVEHVTAVPLGDSQGNCNENSDDIFDQVCSELLRFTARVAGYVPFNDKGLSLAVSLRAGVIQHLTALSRTYPDRLFFMGGVDTLRGYTQYSLVPQDLAEPAEDPDNDISIDEVVLRGGDIFINPRLELRVPLNKTFQTALFVDAGNLWADRAQFNPLQLRYTTGTGLRITTPVGPLVFDYGFNIERVIDKLTGREGRRRTWEPLGAFHFSIGVF